MDDLIMYTKVSGEGDPIEYAFGAEWVAMALYMDDVGTETEDQAVLEWYYKVFKKRHDGSYYVPTKQDFDVEIWMTMHPGNESQEILNWYHNIYKKEWFHADKSRPKKDSTSKDHSKDGEPDDSI